MNTAWLWYKKRPTLVAQLIAVTVILSIASVVHYFWPDVVSTRFIVLLAVGYLSSLIAQYLVLL